MEQHIKTRMKKGKQDTITLVHKSLPRVSRCPVDERGWGVFLGHTRRAAVGYKSSPAPSPPPKVLDDTISLRAYFA